MKQRPATHQSDFSHVNPWCHFNRKKKKQTLFLASLELQSPFIRHSLNSELSIGIARGADEAAAVKIKRIAL